MPRDHSGHPPIGFASTCYRFLKCPPKGSQTPLRWLTNNVAARASRAVARFGVYASSCCRPDAEVEGFSLHV